MLKIFYWLGDNVKKIPIVFLLVGVGIGGVFTLQMKSGVLHTDSSPLSGLMAEEKLLQLFVIEQQKLEKELGEVQEEVGKIEEQQQALTSYAKREELLSLRTAVGLEVVNGEGVRIFFADAGTAARNGDFSDEVGFVHTADIRDIINVLFSSGAKAISINGRRVLPLYSVNFVGSSFLINGLQAFPPFVIQAVGPSASLKARLADERFLPSIYQRVKQKELRFVIAERENLTIPGYQGSLRPQFLKLLNDEEVPE